MLGTEKKWLAVYEALRDEIGERTFDGNDVHGVSVTWLGANGLITDAEKVTRTPLSLQDACDLLNEMDGEDCWSDCADGYNYYEVVDDVLYLVRTDYCGYKWTVPKEEFDKNRAIKKEVK